MQSGGKARYFLVYVMPWVKAPRTASRPRTATSQATWYHQYFLSIFTVIFFSSSQFSSLHSFLGQHLDRKSKWDGSRNQLHTIWLNWGRERKEKTVRKPLFECNVNWRLVFVCERQFEVRFINEMSKNINNLTFSLELLLVSYKTIKNVPCTFHNTAMFNILYGTLTKKAKKKQQHHQLAKKLCIH